MSDPSCSDNMPNIAGRKSLFDMLCSRPNSPMQWARTAALGLLAAVVVAVAWQHVSYTASLLRYPYEWDEDEGLAVYAAANLAAGKPIYVDHTRLPMLTTCYPPVYHAAVATLVPRFGATLLAGRLVSVLAGGLACLVAVAAVRRQTRQWFPALLAGALLLGGPFVSTFSAMCRVDMLAMLLVLGGTFLVWRFPRSPAAAGAGLVLLLLACYTKYQSAPLVLPAFLCLWQANRRVAVIGMAAFATAGVAALILLQQSTGGRFWASTVTLQASQYGLELLASRTRLFLEKHAIVTAGAVGWLLWRLHERRLDPWAGLAIVGVGLALLTGKDGASVNYFIPLAAACAICTAMALDLIASRLPPHLATPGVALAAAALAIQGAIWLGQAKQPSEASRAAGDHILNVVRSHAGDVLTERRLMFALLADREPQIDACTLFLANRAGADGADWRPTALIDAVAAKKYALIVLEKRFLPKSVLEAIAAHYRLLEESPVRMGNWHGENQYVLLVPQS